MKLDYANHNFKYYFPRFSELYPESLEELKINLSTDEDIEKICFVIDNALVKNYKLIDYEMLNLVCTNFVKDLVDLREKLTDIRRFNNCTFLQIYVSMFPIFYGINTNMLQITHDWIIYSISDQVPYGSIVDYKINRFMECFIYACDFAKNVLSVDFTEWLGHLFYYSFSTGGLRELVTKFSEISIKIIRNWYREVSQNGMEINDKMINMMIHHSSIMYILDIDKCRFSVNILEKLLVHDCISSKNKVLIMEQMCCIPGQLSSKSTNEWAEEILLDMDNITDELGKIIVIISSFNSEINKALERKGLLIASIKNYVSSILERDEPSTIYAKARTFKIINIPIELFIKHGYYEIANEILSTWYAVPKLDKKLLYCLPNQMDGPLFASESHLTIHTYNTPEQFRDVIEITNDFLSRNNTINTDGNFKLKEYPRPGVPTIELSKKFEQKMRTYYKLDDLAAKKDLLVGNVENLIIIPNLQHPIQTLMLKYIGFTLPITVSFKQPYIDKKIKRVLLWSVGSLTSSLESNALNIIFTKAGFQVDYYNYDIDKEEFLIKYNSSEYDVVWIISHGNYDHYNPHTSDISTSNDSSPLFINDLRNIQNGNNERRLLVLNVCDGGTSAAYGNPNDFGIASLITSEHQATISHIWPTDSWFAVLFGVLLAIGLTTSNSYFEAYTYAMKYMYSSKSEVISEICKYLGSSDEIIEKLQYRDLDFDKIYYWGSPVFYE